MKKILLPAILGLCLVGGTAFADTKIGVIDLNKVLASYPQVKSLQAQLKKEFEPRGKELAAAQKTLQAEVEKFNKDSEKLKGDELKKAQGKIVADEKSFQEKRDKFQRELMAAQNKSMQTVLNAVEKVVNDFAAKEKYDLILTKVSTAYSNSALDVTSQVIKALK